MGSFPINRPYTIGRTYKHNLRVPGSKLPVGGRAARRELKSPAPGGGRGAFVVLSGGAGQSGKVMPPPRSGRPPVIRSTMASISAPIRSSRCSTEREWP